MTTARERAAALRRDSPAFDPWLSVLEVAIEAIGDGAWDAVLAGPELAGATLAVNGRAATKLLDRLLAAAGKGTDPGARSLRIAARKLPLADVLGAALRQDRPALERIAATVDASPEAFAPVAELAALPLLHACRRSVRAEGSDGWCPVCGAWPALAELRGLDRARRLRCGRCGADWGLHPLTCPYCGNHDHERQRSLVPAAGGESRRIDACDACRGYVKTLPRLVAIPPEQVPLEDLATVELDLAALERDYRRPPARPLAAEVEVR